MDIDKIIAEVERLDREATPRPYAASPGSLSNWKIPGPQPDLLVEWAVNGFGNWTLAQQEIDTQAMAACRNAAPVLAAEVKRLRAGGCARDQRTTQFCAEAVAKDAEIAKLRDQILGYQQQLHIAEQEIARLKGTMIEPTEETGDPDSEQSEGVA